MELCIQVGLTCYYKKKILQLPFLFVIGYKRRQFLLKKDGPVIDITRHSTDWDVLGPCVSILTSHSKSLIYVKRSALRIELHKQSYTVLQPLSLRSWLSRAPLARQRWSHGPSFTPNAIQTYLSFPRAQTQSSSRPKGWAVNHSLISFPPFLARCAGIGWVLCTGVPPEGLAKVLFLLTDFIAMFS